MKDDFKDFVSNSTLPKEHIDQSILDMVSNDLRADPKAIWTKLILIHSFIGLITMLFCPQFHFSLTNQHQLFHYFHQNFGEQICMIFCGGIFIGSGALFASQFLSQAEIFKIRQSRFLYYMTLSILAVGSFAVLGAKIYLSLVLFWILGAIVSGILVFELNHFLKHIIFKRSLS